MSQYIKDGGTWKTVANQWIKDGGVWKPIDLAYIKDGGAWKTYFNREISARFWRIYSYEVQNVDNHSTMYTVIQDIELRDSVGGTNLVDFGNQGGANESTFLTNGYEGENAYDGNSSTIWSSEGYTSQRAEWVRWDFGNNNYLVVQEVAITSHDDGDGDFAPVDFAVEYYDPSASSWFEAIRYNGLSWTAGEQKTFVV